LVDRWLLEYSHHCYDIGVTLAGEAGWSRRLAGHVETGRASISDPAAIEPIPTFAAAGPRRVAARSE
jgi:phospholipase C